MAAGSRPHDSSTAPADTRDKSDVLSEDINMTLAEEGHTMTGDPASGLDDTIGEQSWASEVDRHFPITNGGLDDDIVDFDDDGLDDPAPGGSGAAETVLVSDARAAVASEMPAAAASGASVRGNMDDAAMFAKVIARLEQLELQQREDHRQLQTAGFTLATLQSEVKRIASSPTCPTPSHAGVQAQKRTRDATSPVGSDAPTRKRMAAPSRAAAQPSSSSVSEHAGEGTAAATNGDG
ncbi:hypothetical protein K488DRAFT_92507, partial [Vararia minispora EC-137]